MEALQEAIQLMKAPEEPDDIEIVIKLAPADEGAVTLT